MIFNVFGGTLNPTILHLVFVLCCVLALFVPQPSDWLERLVSRRPCSDFDTLWSLYKLSYNY